MRSTRGNVEKLAARPQFNAAFYKGCLLYAEGRGLGLVLLDAVGRIASARPGFGRESLSVELFRARS